MPSEPSYYNAAAAELHALLLLCTPPKGPITAMTWLKNNAQSVHLQDLLFHKATP
jgi:hypothetical protein